VPQPEEGPLPGRADAAHREAKAIGEIEIALTLGPQQLGEYRPLPVRQGLDGAVETVMLITACHLGAWIALPIPVVGQLCHVQLREHHLAPIPAGQPDTRLTVGLQPAEPSRSSRSGSSP
jgi:hypothetical protein